MIPFTKLHGNGNDFILIDEYDNELIPDKKSFAVKYCDRHFGIGGDGVLFLSASDRADVRMRIFNPDGSEAGMCGNGIRCLVKYALDKGYICNGAGSVETITGSVLPVDLWIEDDTTWIKVGMGKPEFEFLMQRIEDFEVSAVNTGVPHAVVILENLDIPITEIAPRIRYSKIFPEGANVNFVRIDSTDEITVRTYERGVEAETLSCGTGSVASAVVANRLWKIKDSVLVHTKGGVLRITLENGYAFMHGPAKKVFTGVIDMPTDT